MGQNCFCFSLRNLAGDKERLLVCSPWVKGGVDLGQRVVFTGLSPAESGNLSWGGSSHLPKQNRWNHSSMEIQILSISGVLDLSKRQDSAFGQKMASRWMRPTILFLRIHTCLNVQVLHGLPTQPRVFYGLAECRVSKFFAKDWRSIQDTCMHK